MLLVLAVVVTLASLGVGAENISPGAVWSALTHYDPTNTDHISVLDKRLPRTVVGLLAGAALGLAGTIAQGLTRNPLGDPGVLGINQGAALAVVIGLTVFGAGRPSQYMWFALLGAAVAAMIIWLFAARGRDGATPVKLALAGAAVAAAFVSVVSGLMIANQESLDLMRFWQVGGLAGRGYAVLLPTLPIMLPAIGVALLIGRQLNLLALGDEAATGLGLRVGRARLVAGILVVLLAGTATAVCGPIAFLGLIVPHLVRLATGPDHRWVLAGAAPAGAVLLVAADVIGRLLARPGELQVGIVVAVIGAPVFIAVVRRGRMASL